MLNRMKFPIFNLETSITFSHKVPLQYCVTLFGLILDPLPPPFVMSLYDTVAPPPPLQKKCHLLFEWSLRNTPSCMKV